MNQQSKQINERKKIGLIVVEKAKQLKIEPKWLYWPILVFCEFPLTEEEKQNCWPTLVFVNSLKINWRMVLSKLPKEQHQHNSLIINTFDYLKDNQWLL